MSVKIKCSKCKGAGYVTDYRSIAGVLARTRKAHKPRITQGQMAKWLHVSQSFLCDLEKGRKVITPELVKQYNALLKD